MRDGLITAAQIAGAGFGALMAGYRTSVRGYVHCRNDWMVAWAANSVGKLRTHMPGSSRSTDITHALTITHHVRTAFIDRVCVDVELQLGGTHSHTHITWTRVLSQRSYETKTRTHSDQSHKSYKQKNMKITDN